MAGSFKDIYRKREETKSSDPHASSAMTEAERLAWLRMRPRLQITTIAFALIVVLLLAVFIAVIRYQQNILEEARATAAARALPTAHALDLAPLAVIPEGAPNDMAERLMLQDLSTYKPTPLPTEGITDMTPQWLRQAAWHLMMAEAAYRRQQWDEVLAQNKEALAIMPSMKGVQKFIGIAALMQKKYEPAEAAFRKALAETPDSAVLLNNLGVTLMSNEKYQEAEKAFQQAMEKGQDYAPPHYNLALLYCRLKDDERAADAFKTYTTRFPHLLQVQFVNTYAAVLMRLQRWTEVVPILKLSLSLNDGVALTYIRLAEALAKADAPEEAMATLKKVLGTTDARQALQWLAMPAYDALRAREDFQQLIKDLQVSRP